MDAGKLSTRIRGDKDPQEIAFAVDNDGTRANAGQLTRDISWLYFQPTIASMVMRYRGSHLHWYSGETGALGATAGSTVHFGVNDLGLITVLAKDIGQLPQWQQRLWSAHNVTPEGEVSSELFEAQMMLIPASTKAPEGEVQDALNTLDASFKKRYGTSLLREHSSVTQLLRAVHRFRAVEEGGLLDLSKDLMRLFSERVDVDALTPHFTLANGEKKRAR
ncbi:hypothetical protein [Phyllobacterium salinisoli]|uniref:hypothetical protein n=1 Tax=Phyllobacterium salinisoli TaxID=1899321 RepID=UPI0011C05790|nr:hypothetical protein [Phyllobacterium salinisoli]